MVSTRAVGGSQVYERRTGLSLRLRIGILVSHAADGFLDLRPRFRESSQRPDHYGANLRGAARGGLDQDGNGRRSE